MAPVVSPAAAAKSLSGAIDSLMVTAAMARIKSFQASLDVASLRVRQLEAEHNDIVRQERDLAVKKAAVALTLEVANNHYM